MSLRARPLHILALAPVAAIVAAATGATAHAQGSAATSPPAPIVIAVDPGHGGLPDNNNPSQPFDPGAISDGGLMEKVVTLDVAQRVAALLQQDLVDPVLTRSSDVWVDIPTREQIAIDARAQLFVSIHVNAYTDPSIGGSLVLYPNAASQAFAQTLEDSLGRDLASSGVGDDGIVLRDNWWIHNPMPTATVEMAYMSNAHEAQLMGTEDFRQQVAIAIRDGVERFYPQIAQRKAAILAWEHAHPGAPPPGPPAVAGHPAQPAAHPARGGSPFGTVLGWLVAAAALALAVRWRRGLARVLVPLLALAARAAGGGIEILAETLEGSKLHRAAARRRRRRLRVNGLTSAPARRWAPTSVYDELSF